MMIPVLGLISNLCEPQIGPWVGRTHRLLAGLNRKVFLNQWGVPDIQLSPDHLLESFKLDFLCLKSDPLEKNPLTVWIYEKKDTLLIFRGNRLIFHFKWNAFKQKFKKPEIVM